MADNDSPLFSERRHQRHHVADVVEDAVRIDMNGCAGSAEAPHIRRGDMETRRRKHLDLMPPRIGPFRPSTAKHHQRTFALFQQKDLDPVGGNGARGQHRLSALFRRFCCVSARHDRVVSPAPQSDRLRGDP
jgi:hypothetical protein